ncbi:MAG: AfsR/SARP family transcriptional regulator [Nitrososphaerales archaeon]
MFDSAPCLRVYLLGPAFVEWQGQCFAIARRQARGLLYRLAAQAEPVPREELCFTFWPDKPEADGHRHLSHLLSQLRQSLPLPAVVRAKNELVDLDRQLVWSDSAFFWSACAQEGGDVRALKQALELYRGPFMSGFPLPACPEFGHWVAAQRTIYQRLYLDALTTVIALEASQSNYNRAIFYARRYLRVNELAEDVHRQLMMLHLRAGDRPGALQQYERCVYVLKRELGIEPLPETRAVYRAIMDNRLAT